MHIKILGPGCPNCKKLAQLTEQAVKELGIEATIEKVEAMQEIMKYRILMTPGLVINEKLVLAGKVPNQKELLNIINKERVSND
jgi:small redox-active disulfide protein 2